MKKMNIAQVLTSCLVCCGIAAATTSCNDEWKDEQYEKYISFKAPLNDNGVTAVYVPYSRHNDDGSLMYGAEGRSSYDLPVIVAGTTRNDRNLTVHVGHVSIFGRYLNRLIGTAKRFNLAFQKILVKGSFCLHRIVLVSEQSLEPQERILFFYDFQDSSGRSVFVSDILAGNGFRLHVSCLDLDGIILNIVGDQFFHVIG